MNLENLNLEKYEVLERERQSTFADSAFQNWAKELNVSQSYEDREGIIRANDLNKQYDYSTLSSGRTNGIRSIASFLSKL